MVRTRGVSLKKNLRIFFFVGLLGSYTVGGAIHQLRPMKTSKTRAHSVRTVASVSTSICHQVSGLLMICSTIHHTISPTPSKGAMNLIRRECAG